MQETTDPSKHIRMETLFQQRTTNWDLPPVINEYTLERIGRECPELALRYSSARRRRFPDDLHDTHKWPELPAGIRRDMAGQPFNDTELQIRYVGQAVKTWLTDTMIDQVADYIINELGNRTLRTIVVVYPYPINRGTHNITTKAIASELVSRLQNHRAIPRSVNLIVGTNETNPDLEESVYMVARGKRGRINENELAAANTSSQIYQELVAKRLALQVSFAGHVDTEAAYILCDDGITAQSTMMNLFNYIAPQAKVLCAVTLRATAPECRSIAITPQTQEFLDIQLARFPILEKRRLQKLTATVGCRLGDPDIGRSLLTNVEALLLGAYLATDNSAGRVMNVTLPAFHQASRLPGGTHTELQKLFHAILKTRVPCS